MSKTKEEKKTLMSEQKICAMSPTFSNEGTIAKVVDAFRISVLNAVLCVLPVVYAMPRM